MDQDIRHQARHMRKLYNQALDRKLRLADEVAQAKVRCKMGYEINIPDYMEKVVQLAAVSGEVLFWDSEIHRLCFRNSGSDPRQIPEYLPSSHLTDLVAAHDPNVSPSTITEAIPFRIKNMDSTGQGTRPAGSVPHSLVPHSNTL